MDRDRQILTPNLSAISPIDNHMHITPQRNQNIQTLQEMDIRIVLELVLQRNAEDLCPLAHSKMMGMR